MYIVSFPTAAVGRKVWRLKRYQHHPRCNDWRRSQSDSYGEEVKTMMKNREVPNNRWSPIEKCSSLYNDSPFLDDEGVIRMEGRAALGSVLRFELRFSIILPKKHPITRKFLKYYHQQAAHANTEIVVNDVRQRFRITNLRTTLKAVVKACMWCRMKKCTPKVPRMAPLPLGAYYSWLAAIQLHRSGLLRSDYSHGWTQV